MTEVPTASPAESTPAPEAPAPQPTTAPPAPSTDDVATMLTEAGFEGNLPGAMEAAKGYQSARRAGAIDNYRQMQAEATRLGHADVPALMAALASVEREEAPAETPAQPVADPDYGSQDVTLDDVGNVVAQQLAVAREQDRSDYAAQQEQIAVQAARQAEDDFYVETLRQGKFEIPDSGELPLDTAAEASRIQICLARAKTAHLDEFSTPQDREAALAAHPTQGQLEAAKTMFVNSLKDRDGGVVDRYAADQETIQTSVPGGPPSGASPPNNFDFQNATIEQRNEWLAKKLEARGISEDEYTYGRG